MKASCFALLLLAILIANPMIGQDTKKLIRVPLYRTLDTISHDSERFYLEKTIPEISEIPQDLDTFLIFSCSFSSHQMVYENYKRGLIPEQRFKSINIDPQTLIDHPIKHKLYALSGLRGEKKIVIADTNNNGSFADETIMEFSTAVSEEIIFAKDNWSSLMLVHIEQFSNDRIRSRQVLGKIDPYVKLVNPPSNLEEKLMLTFKEFEYRKGIFSVDGENFLITAHRSGNLFKLIALDKPDQVNAYTKEASIEWEQVYFKLYGEVFKKITIEYYVTGYPTYFLIDPQGRIMTRGGLEDLREDLEKILNEK